MHSYLSQQLRLFRVDQYQFGGQVEDLHLDLGLLLGEIFGHFPQDVWDNFGHAVGVLSEDPEDGSPGSWNLINKNNRSNGCPIKMLHFLRFTKVGTLHQNLR